MCGLIRARSSFNPLIEGNQHVTCVPRIPRAMSSPRNKPGGIDEYSV